MTQAEFEESNNVLIIPKTSSWVMRVIGWFFKSFMTDFWTTYRFPFCRARITYPTGVVNPIAHTGLLQHELVHVGQLKPAWGPLWVFLCYFLIPFPALLSGRFIFIEASAYAQDVAQGRLTPEVAADILWKGYFYPWPRKWMIKYLEKYRPQAAGSIAP